MKDGKMSNFNLETKHIENEIVFEISSKMRCHYDSDNVMNEFFHDYSVTL